MKKLFFQSAQHLKLGKSLISTDNDSVKLCEGAEADQLESEPEPNRCAPTVPNE